MNWKRYGAALLLSVGLSACASKPTVHLPPAQPPPDLMVPAKPPMWFQKQLDRLLAEILGPTSTG